MITLFSSAIEKFKELGMFFFIIQRGPQAHDQKNTAIFFRPEEDNLTQLLLRKNVWLLCYGWSYIDI